jgi:RNA polymerase subunit RPABC4/transcription elongation factor Spt4
MVSTSSINQKFFHAIIPLGRETMNLDPSVLKQLSLFATGFSVAFLAALWLSLIFWAFRDIRKRTRDSFMRILAVIVVAVLFLPGILIYLILRPPRTLEEEYQQSLEEEALLQTIEDASICPGCNRRIESTWLACPNCHTLLKKQCKTCGKVINLPWNLCPYCATPVDGMQKEPAVVADTSQPPLDEDLLSPS